MGAPGGLVLKGFSSFPRVMVPSFSRWRITSKPEPERKSQALYVVSPGKSHGTHQALIR
jgi:hypothetical protein